MGCGCGGAKQGAPVTAGGGIRYEVEVAPGVTESVRSPGQARALAVRKGGKAFRVGADGTRTPL